MGIFCHQNSHNGYSKSNSTNMFQKLYRHLEEVNANLRRQELAAETSGTYEKEILEQLQVLNARIESGKIALQGALKRPSPVFPIVILVVAILAIGAIVFLDLRVSDLTRGLAVSEDKANRQVELQIESTRKGRSLYSQQQEEAAQLSRLDSIIREQNQTILELKDLNKISVHTFVRLKNRIDHTDHLIRLRQSDSGGSRAF